LRRCAEQGWAVEGSQGGRGAEPGDLVFFGTAEDLHHVGLVEGATVIQVRTVEGNSGDAVRRRAYGVGDARIFGLVRPAPWNPDS
jgi:cell wall-associated NlpC family hydrolase